MLIKCSVILFFLSSESIVIAFRIVFSYNITSGMIIIDDIMSEIVLEISRVRRTSEMSCFNFTIPRVIFDETI
jgi:hypothetical protein